MSNEIVDAEDALSRAQQKASSLYAGRIEVYAKAIKGRYADLTNSPADRRAHPISGAEFLHHFAGDVPWAHLDIAGVANNSGLDYIGAGGAGWGVRLLVTLAERLAA